MKQFLISSLLFLPSLSFADRESADLSSDCFNMSNQALICVYNGKTGLEMLPSAKLHQIHRLPVYYGNEFGSVVLIKSAQLKNLTFNECWSTSYTNTRKLILFCQDHDNPKRRIPKLILNEIGNLRAN